MGDRDTVQRDMHKFQKDREYLRKLGELALASSLNSFTKNGTISSPPSDRLMSPVDCGKLQSPQSLPSPPDRDMSSSHYHTVRSASMLLDKSLDRNRNPELRPTHPSIAEVYSGSISSDYGPLPSVSHYGTVKLRKHASMSEKKPQPQRNSNIETSDTNSHTSYMSYEDVAVMMANRESMNRQHFGAIRKYEVLKEEHDFLHKRYADLVNAYTSAMFKLELVQEDLTRMRKNYEELAQEKNGALRDRNGLQQQCTAAIRQWDKALRECNEAKELLAKVQSQRDDAMKEVNQAMTWRIKATKDLARLTEERNAAIQEYSLIMSERDTVHKEIDKLQEELHESHKKIKSLEDDREKNHSEIEQLKKEVLASASEKQRLMRECFELRERYSDVTDDNTASPTSPSRSSISSTPSGLNLWGSSSSGISMTSWMLSSSKNPSNLIKLNELSAMLRQHKINE